jgi:hypothetical protein
LVYDKNANFFRRKLAKIAENCDNNIDHLLLKTGLRSSSSRFRHIDAKKGKVPAAASTLPPGSIHRWRGETASRTSLRTTGGEQGDQMSLGKITQNIAQPIFLVKIYYPIRNKVTQICGIHPWFSSYWPKYTNHPLGENSSNLVTLVIAGARKNFCCCAVTLDHKRSGPNFGATFCTVKVMDEL